MPKGYKVHPITKEIVKAFTKVPIPAPPTNTNINNNTIDYNSILEEYYNNIKNGVLTTIELFLASTGLSESQIHYFLHGYLKNKPEFWETVLNLTRSHYHSNSIQIDEALKKKCLEGDPRAIKLYYERIEGWISQISSPVTNVTLVFSDGMVSDDEKGIIELKRVKPIEIEGTVKGEEVSVFTSSQGEDK